MHNNIICFFVLVVVSVLFSMSSAADVRIVGVAASIVVSPPRPPQEEQTTPKDDDGKRRKRSTSSTNTTAVVNKVNSLRKSVGASDMTYLTYSTLLESDIANWTGYCDFDAYVYTRQPAYVVYSISTSFLQTFDQIEVLEEIYSDPKFFNRLRSVYLQSVGAYTGVCLSAISEGQNYAFVYVNVYAFAKTSYFNENVTQYTLGEECTTCRSGSYWCYDGLCRDGCSDSDSDCYCNSYCLNCAATDSTTCRCRCLNGWIGSRCETAYGSNTTTPTCSTTRIPRTSTTTSTTSKSTVASTTTSTTSKNTVASTTTSTTSKSTVALTTPSTTSKSTVASTTPSTTSKSTVASTTTSTTSKSIDAATRSTNTGSSIGKSMFRLGFYAAVALLSRI